MDNKKLEKAIEYLKAAELDDYRNFEESQRTVLIAAAEYLKLKQHGFLSVPPFADAEIMEASSDACENLDAVCKVAELHDCPLVWKEDANGQKLPPLWFAYRDMVKKGSEQAEAFLAGIDK